jgi:formate hydrogenlyase subunit 3/multisubunit Na+/H+ antiporter MnhD subunit
MERGQVDWARALLLTSICVKLAAIPLCFWLMRLADEVPSLVLGSIIAVVDMAAFGEAYLVAQGSPSLFTPQAFLFGLAAATSLVAALLMLTQHSLKRLLVLSTIEDVGFLLFGLASATKLGASGALAAAVTHAVAKALLFACLSAPEAAGELEAEPIALASRYPVSAFGFLFGMLAMLGVPPTIGFVGRWRLYETALVVHPMLLAVFVISSILALVAYVLALTRAWWGPADSPPVAKEPALLAGTIVVLVALLLASGIWPNALALLQGGRS